MSKHRKTFWNEFYIDSSIFIFFPEGCRIPDPKIGGSIPFGGNFFTTRRHLVRVVEEVDLLGSARASANLVDVAFFLVTKVCYFFMAKKTTATRFELAEPSRFRIYLLNHSDMLPLSIAQSWPSGQGACLRRMFVRAWVRSPQTAFYFQALEVFVSSGEFSYLATK